MFRTILLTFCAFFILNSSSLSAQFHRISAEFTIKEKRLDGTYSLTKGTVFYDKNIKKIIYNITFPVEQTLVLHDTSMFIYRDGQLYDRQQVPNTNQFSVFHLCLNSDLNNYGLDNTEYKIDAVEKEGDMVITTWMPPKKLNELFGKTMISQKNKQLYGVVFFTPEETIMGKQFYRKYANINGLNFPTEIIQITMKNAEEYYKTTEFKKIKVNEADNINSYDYVLPGS